MRGGLHRGLVPHAASGRRRLEVRLPVIREPVYDVKTLDKLVTRVAREIRLLEQALKATNAKTVIEGYDQDDTALGELT